MADSAFGNTGNIPIPDWYNGNIDLDNRQIYKHPDGYIQTEHSIGTGFDPGDKYSIRLPQIINGKPVANEQAARDYFMKTGEHLGIDWRGENETPSSFYKRTDDRSNAIHERQAQFYKQEMNDWRQKVEAAR